MPGGTRRPPFMPARMTIPAALAACLHLGAAAQTIPTSAAPSYTVLAAGDIAHCSQPDTRWTGAAATAAVVAHVLSSTPHAAVLLLGDNVYERGTEEEFAHCYGPTWGRFKARTHPAPGNHEYYTKGAAGYFRYFGAAAGAGYYSLTLGSWRVYSLDSNLDGEAQAAQLDWLRRDLARHPARCTLAYWHHPLYSSGWHGSKAHMRPAWEILQAAGAELVLAGHDHVYERFAPQDAGGRLDAARGMRQFVVGTGGAYSTPFSWPLPNSEVRDNSRTGVLRLDLDEGGYRWEFLEAQYHGFPNGRAPDRGGAPCH